MQTEKKTDIFDIMASTPEEATKMLREEFWKQTPDFQVIEDILAYSHIDVNLQDRNGRTALMVAAYRRNEKCVELLLNHPGIDVTLKNHKGFTAWDFATDSIRKKFPKLNPNS